MIAPTTETRTAVHTCPRALWPELFRRRTEAGWTCESRLDLGRGQIWSRWKKREEAKE